MDIGKWCEFATEANLARLERHLAARARQGNLYATWLYNWLRGCDTTAEKRELLDDLTYRMQQPDTGRPCASLTTMRSLLAECRDHRRYHQCRL
jgi:hypothetical protein